MSDARNFRVLLNKIVGACPGIHLHVCTCRKGRISTVSLWFLSSFHMCYMYMFCVVSNTAVMLFKLIAYLYTGSASMLSEAVHSLVDVLNQVRPQFQRLISLAV